MKITLVVLVIVSSGFAAPVDDITDIDLQRTKKSSPYGAPTLPSGPPCAGATIPYGPVSIYLPQSAPIPHYREDVHEEMKPSARAYYDSAAIGPAPGIGYAGANAGNGLGPSAHSGGSAVGMFPNAKIGGCNVPLLLSCSPNVISGHLASAPAYPAYRTHEDDANMMKAGWTDERVASHHKVSQDYPDINASNHHLVSKDYPQPNLTRITVVQGEKPTEKQLDKKN